MFVNGYNIPVLIIDEEQFSADGRYISIARLCYSQNRLFKVTFDRDLYSPIFDDKLDIIGTFVEDTNIKTTVLCNYIQCDEWDKMLSSTPIDY